MVEKSGRKPEDYALHSLRIGSASMLAGRGDVSERVMQREGRWKPDAYKVHTLNNADDARHVSRKLAAGKGLQRQPGRDTVDYGVNCRRSLGVAPFVEESMVLDHSVPQSSRNSHCRTQTVERGR